MRPQRIRYVGGREVREPLVPSGPPADWEPVARPVLDPVAMHEAEDIARLAYDVIEAGCAEEIPEAERTGCGCVRRCLRGRSRRRDRGVTLAECYRCPDRPRSKSDRSDSTDRDE